MMKFDEEPIFDKDYMVKNIPNISFPVKQGWKTIVLMLNKEGQPCQRQYLNGDMVEELSFVDFDSLQIYKKKEMILYDEFCEFMKEYEKAHAKIIRITKTYEEI